MGRIAFGGKFACGMKIYGMPPHATQKVLLCNMLNIKFAASVFCFAFPFRPLFFPSRKGGAMVINFDSLLTLNEHKMFFFSFCLQIFLTTYMYQLIAGQLSWTTRLAHWRPQWFFKAAKCGLLTRRCQVAKVVYNFTLCLGFHLSIV